MNIRVTYDDREFQFSSEEILDNSEIDLPPNNLDLNEILSNFIDSHNSLYEVDTDEISEIDDLETYCLNEVSDTFTFHVLGNYLKL